MNALVLMIRQHKLRPFQGPVLILGRQHVFGTYEGIVALLKSEGIEPAPLAPGTDLRSNVCTWKGTAAEQNASDVLFFKLLGLDDVLALDHSDFEGAEITWDLNLPVPAELRNRFGLILDGGTLEHVFDVRQAFSNVASMLKAGGDVYHMSPINNYCNHGFYQFSPTFFYDFYLRNGFTNIEGSIVVTSAENPSAGTWHIHPYTPVQNNTPIDMSDKTRACLFFRATRTAEATTGDVPQQSFYADRMWKFGAPQDG